MLLTGPTAFPEPFTPVAPLGSLIYESSPVSGAIQFAGDITSYTLPVNANETIAVVVRPTNASANPLQPQLEVTDPTGSFTIEYFANAAGVAAVVQGVPSGPGGTLPFTVSGENGTTGNFTAQVILNADLDSAVAYGQENSTLGTADIIGGFVDLAAAGAYRLADVGHFEGTPDFYSFQLDAGQFSTIGLTLASNIPATLQVEDGNGNVLATGAPIAQDVSLVIHDFVAPVDGTYYAVISGAGESDYSLIATVNADFDLEPNDRIGEAQSLHGVHTVLGAIGNGPISPDVDFYAVQVNAGDTLTLTTSTPSDQGGEFHNTLVPQIDLYDNFTNLVVSNAGQSKNASLSYIAQTAGTYFVEVSGANASSGEYVLDIEGATGRLLPPSVKTSVLDGHILQIVGDSTGHLIDITDNGAGGVGVVADRGANQFFTGIDQIMVGSGAGDDSVSYRFVPPGDPDRTRPANLFVDLGAGNDSIIADASAGLGPIPTGDRPQTWNVNILGGDGNDNITLIASMRAGPIPVGDMPAPVLMNVDGGAGDDVIGVNFNFQPVPTGDFVMTPVDVPLLGGGGNDQVTVRVEGMMTSKLNVSADLGAGDDRFVFDASDATFNAPLIVNAQGGDGNDSILTRFDAVLFNPQPDPPAIPLFLNIQAGGGDDNILTSFDAVAFNPQPDPPANPYSILVQGGDGNDTASLGFTGGSLAGALATAVDLGAGDDSFLLDAQPGWVDPGPCRVAVSGGDGNDNVVIRSEGMLNANLNVAADLGMGDDSFLFDAQAGWVDPGPCRVAVSGGPGNDQVMTRLGPLAGDLTFAVDLGLGNDLFDAHLMAGGVPRGGDPIFAVAGGFGNDRLSFTVASMPDQPTPAPLMSPLLVSLDGGPDNDTILVNYNNVLLDAPQVVSEFGGLGNDTIGLSLVNPSPSTTPLLNLAASFGLFGGLGDDFIFVNINDPYGVQPFVNVFEAGGAGTDIMALTYTGRLNSGLRFRLLGEDGNDQIQAVCTIDFVSTGLFDGLVSGGAGNDHLTFDLFLVFPNGNITGNALGNLAYFLRLLDGGSGFDVCSATPNIIVKNCEA